MEAVRIEAIRTEAVRTQGGTSLERGAVSVDGMEPESSRERARAYWQPCAGQDSDSALIDRILRGDRRAGDLFVARYGRLIAAILRRMGLQTQEREDLYQQVFVHLWERNCCRLSQWQARGNGKFSSFLEVVVVRLVYDYYRRIRERGHYMESLDQMRQGGDYTEAPYIAAQTPDLDHLIACRQEKAAIDRMLLRLSPRDAQVIRRRHYHDQSYREISDALGIRIEQVGIVLMRAERRLRRHLALAHPDVCA
jgi:RNA polymerase sigma-70 factor, ECF subfamily